MKRFITSLGILSLFLPLTTQALVLPGVQRQLPGQYQNVAQPSTTIHKSSSSSAVTQNVERSLSLNIRFSYPSNWDILDSMTFLALWPHDNGMSAKTDNSAIRIDAESLRTAADYTDVQLDNYFKSFVTIANQSSPLIDYYVPSFHLINESGATLLGHHARMYTYTGDVRSVHQKMTLVLATMNQKLYEVYYHSSPETFDKGRPVFDAVLKSLQWNVSSSSSASSLSSRFLLHQRRGSSSSVGSRLR